MTDTFFRPDDSLRGAHRADRSHPAARLSAQGEVHDENAYALGGVAGHAGLFSTASDLSIFAQMMLERRQYNGTRIVADSTVRSSPSARRARARSAGTPAPAQAAAASS